MNGQTEFVELFLLRSLSARRVPPMTGDLRRVWVCALILILVAVLTATPAADDFFKGKTIRIIVGFSPGGGYDVYARLIARHMGKFIPGNPAIIVENMAGAASLISANHVYKVAKPDGLTVGHFIGGLFLQQVLGRHGVEFDARKFEHLDVPVQDTYSIGLTKASGVSSFDQWLSAKTPVKIGGTAPGSSTDDVPHVLQAALGLPLQLVSGYKGTADIRIAAESGEVAGFCTGWESFKSTWRKSLDSGDADLVMRERALDLWNFVEREAEPLSQDRVKKVVRLGKFTREITNFMRDEEVDLLVLNLRRRRRFPDLTTLQLVTIAGRLSCPVLLEPPAIRDLLEPKNGLLTFNLLPTWRFLSCRQAI